MPATPPRPSPAPRVAAIDAYAVPRHPAPVDLRLDGNEGPAPPDLRDILADPELLRRYPSSAALAAVLAARLGVAPDRVLVTAGGDDAIDRLCRATLHPGRTLVLPTPTFEMIPRYARLAGGDVLEVPWPGPRYPIDRVLAAIDERTALVAIVSPNNPTGAIATLDDLRRVCAAARHAVVLVDLAYCEYTDDGEALCAAALAEPNAIVVRTFSKAWGLAGARVGYAAGPADLLAWLRAAGAPYSVAAPSLALAAAMLARGEPILRAHVARIRDERSALERLLAPLADVAPSHANFLLASFRDAAWVRDALAGLGVAVRPFPGRPDLAGALRIGLPGDPTGFARLAHALASALRPEALLFDMDGVLADTSSSYRRAIVDTARGFDVDIDLETIAASKREGDANNDWIVTHRLVTRAGVDVSFAAIKARFESIYHGEPGAPGLHLRERLLAARPLLARLSARLPLAVVTGRPRRDADMFLDRFKLAPFFRAVVTMEDAPRKPDPAPVRLACERLGVARAWLIGDTADDIRAARSARVVPLGVIAPGDDPVPTTASLHAAGAARVLASLEDLEALLP